MKTYRKLIEDKKWIQKATKNMRKDKPCTGEKFGSETCPPGSKRYNLAKTFRKMAKEQANTPEPPKKEADDPSIKAEKKKEGMLKKRVLMQKLRAVRSGVEGIVAHHEPEGEMVEGKENKENKNKGRHPRDQKELDRAREFIKKNPKFGLKEGDVHSGQGEKIQKRTKKWMDKKGMKGAPGLDAMKARTAEHKAKRGVKNEAYKAVTNAPDSLAKMNQRYKPVKKKEPTDTPFRDRLKAKRGVKEERDAYKYVVSKLKKQYGDGVLTKGDKMPELSAAQKKKNAAIRAKRAKEDHRDPTEKASDGRYSDRHSNRGSD